jgi:hypothetical protein
MRFGKPVLVSIVMFCAIFYVSGNVKTAAIAMLIPLIMGSLGITPSIAYGLTGLALLWAIAVAIGPPSVKETAKSLFSQVTAAAQKALPEKN